MTIDADATAGELQALAVRTGYTRFPVVGDGLDDVRGVVGAKDVLSIPIERRAATRVTDLAEPELAVPEQATLADVLADLREHRSQLAVVVDEYGGTAGILTLEDIVEELVGAIEDEYDPAAPEVELLRRRRLARPRRDAHRRGRARHRHHAARGRLRERRRPDDVAPGPGAPPRRRVRVPGATVSVDAMDGHTVTAVVVKRGGR